MIKTTLFILIIVILYIYGGYLLILLILSRYFNNKVIKKEYTPNLAIIISAYNEEKYIERTIYNKLELDYPKDKLSIVVVSDASEDNTDVLVKNINDERIIFFRQETRQGKTAALNKASTLTDADILIFSDANSIYEKESLKYILMNFTDPTVGYVTGKMIYQNKNGTVVGDGCSAYMRYENLLRKYETLISSIVGVDGGIDAIRKELYENMNNDQLPDFILPLKVITKGYRVVFDEKAILREDTTDDNQREYNMRVRVALRAFCAIFDMRHLLNPIKHPLFSWQLISHKILRYLAIIPLMSLFFINISMLKYGATFTVIFVIQCIFYLLALIGFAKRGQKNIPYYLYLPFYFMLLNFASFHAFLKFVKGEKQALWTPRAG